MWNEGLFFIIGLGLGWSLREIYHLKNQVLKLMYANQPKAKPGPTMGIYNPPNEYRQTEHVIVPKSPQLVEWEANERTREENLVSRSVKPQ